MHISIVGITGYTGLELLRLSLNHPHVTVSSIHATKEVGVQISDIFPHLKGVCDKEIQAFDSEFIMTHSDLVFFATPSGVAKDLSKNFVKNNFPVIDLSGDHRLSPDVYLKWYKKSPCTVDIQQRFTYGLSEVMNISHRNRFIANPGCYATATELALYPLINNHLIRVDSIIVDAKSGLTGAGKKLNQSSHYVNVNNNYVTYKLNKHQHIPEIVQTLQFFNKNLQNIQFSTSLIPVNRGIVATIYTQLESGVKINQIESTYKTVYKNKPFIRIKDGLPQLNEVIGTNYTDIGFVYNETTGVLTISSVIDNLIKGAAGQAIQNMNLMFNFDETDGLHAGFKKKKLDFGWIVSEVPANVAGVFTTNKVIAAPLKLTKNSIEKSGKMQAIVVNSGIANSCTGIQGEKDAFKMQQLAANKLQIQQEYVGVASTGVIGKMMPMSILENGFSKLVKNGNADDFAKAILTTDTHTKTCVVNEVFGNDTVTMAGVAKGSGMIHPNLATMLAFITCDANISSQTLQQALKDVVEVTFNQITVDGDTSTNDMVLVMSNGCTNNNEIKKDSEDYYKFKQMLLYIMTDLAKSIARDGEGASKLIEVTVKGAKESSAARMIAKSVVGSSLVKTAIFGEDPNWGRIIASAGYAKTNFDINQVDIFIGRIPVLIRSSPIKYDKEEIQEIMSAEEISIELDLHQGNYEGQAWGCDLSYDYVKINALYTT